VVDRLVLLSWRVGATAANLAIGTAARGAGVALNVVRAVIPCERDGSGSMTDDVFDGTAEAMAEPRSSSARTAEYYHEPEPSQDAERTKQREPHGAPSEPPTFPEPGSVTDYDAEPPTPLDESAKAAKTIDDEPELVAEFAEPGAEEGASAEVEIDEPWDGYDNLSAEDVIARIEHAGPAELAVLELYEQAHKNRQTVLSAAEARYRALENAPG
jgi:hypothetical protein